MPLAIGIHITSSQIGLLWNDRNVVGVEVGLEWDALASAASEIRLDWLVKETAGRSIDLEWRGYPQRWSEIYQGVLDTITADVDRHEWTLLLPSTYTTFLWRGREFVLAPVTVHQAGRAAVLDFATARRSGRVAVSNSQNAHHTTRTMTLT